MSTDNFVRRHIGPDARQTEEMLKAIGVKSLDELIDKVIPPSIRRREPLNIPDGISEFEYLRMLSEIASKNKRYKTFIGQGYYYSICPAVIQRNIFENPSWYTSYTPYQAEISQGRLEALLNFQTMITDLTGMEIANASLLDEATAAAEAMLMLYHARPQEQQSKKASCFFVDQHTFLQTIDVLKTRSMPLGIKIITGDYKTFQADDNFFGALIQYPNARGSIENYQSFVEQLHARNIPVVVAADIMSLVLLVPPGEWGADVVVGSTQRFGIPIGFGGPSAAFFATREKYKRNIPGRIIGVSRDAKGKIALRMALQTREQHIKREKATSNICTSQVLLAIMAGMYAVYHGAQGLRDIAWRIHHTAATLEKKLLSLGYSLLNKNYFDTLHIHLPGEMIAEEIKEIALENEINLFYPDQKTVLLSLDETTTLEDINQLIRVFAIAVMKKYLPALKIEDICCIPDNLLRRSTFLTLQVFNSYHTETAMMRYIKKLEQKDISLTHSMISLGSCTMKMTAATEMLPLNWPAFSDIHPFVPLDQAEGYYEIINELGKYLCEITGMSAVSFQPNSGAAGEYTGLMVIRQYFLDKGETQRNMVLIPASAHGTNPASATMAGFRIEVVACDDKGNISIEDLQAKAEKHKDNLACCMITYPSTHGVFESNIKDIVNLIHRYGGQVYMDGANMNAQVGLTSPGIIGADVCHLNLHKTFGIPHGGGGPGAGPICVADHLVEYLPTHPLSSTGGKKGISAVAASPYGSASILLIAYGYIRLMGGKGLTEATRYAILNANYLAACLRKNFTLLYAGETGYNAHEFIIDCREFKTKANVLEIDIAKRLMDYGFHAPTVSFPVHGTLMIEPTESESKDELERFISAMNTIHEEIKEIESGKADSNDNVLKNAPHTAEEIASDEWRHPYSREKAAYPVPWLRDNKYWPPVSRVDDAYGDRNLVCTCAPIDEYMKKLSS